VKINGNDFNPAGMTAEKVALAGPILEAAGVDMISVSAGGSLTNILGMSADGNQPEGWKVPLAEAVKKSGVKIPVMATGSIRHPDFVEQLLQEGKCDMVGMGRGLLAEPEWVSKLQQGREDEMRACISCMSCFNFTNPGSAGCTINPRALRETEQLELKKNGAQRTVVVVGAGPAGLEAAITLAERGFKPVILEKNKELGGMEVMAAKPDGKAKVLWHLDYYKKQIARLGIEVRFAETATQKSIAALNPYAVFVATGSLPVFPASIPGVKKPQVSEIRQTLEAFPDVTGETIVLVGAGLVGLENSISFANRGNKVSIIDMLPPYDPEKSPVDLMLTFGHAMQCGVNIHMKHKLLEITDDAVIAENLDTGEKVSFPAQRVVFCMGVTSNNKLYEEIKDAFPRIYNIGDSVATGTILNAVSRAFNAAIALE
jgi:thioredoxin reductase